MGRPSKADNWITEDGLKLLTHYKRADLTDAEIAGKIGISPSTLDDWKARFPQISTALKKGREYCVADAEEALLAKFKPYTYKEQSVETWEEYNPKTGRMETKTHKKVTERKALPDTTAIIFYLKCKGGWNENAAAGAIMNPVADSGFLEALGNKAAEDWNETDVQV